MKSHVVQQNFVKKETHKPSGNRLISLRIYACCIDILSSFKIPKIQT